MDRFVSYLASAKGAAENLEAGLGFADKEMQRAESARAAEKRKGRDLARLVSLELPSQTTGAIRRALLSQEKDAARALAALLEATAANASAADSIAPIGGRLPPYAFALTAPPQSATDRITAVSSAIA